MMPSKSSREYENYLIAQFEKLAEERYVDLSDNTSLRVLITHSQENPKGSLIFIAGWGSVVSGWDSLLLEAMKDFDIYYIETREKGSSKLNFDTQVDMDRLSDDIAEIIEKMNIKQNIILFGSCFGAQVVAHILAKKKVDTLFSVLITPMRKMEVPKGTRRLIPYVPHWIIWPILGPLKWWIRTFKSESPEQAAKYIRVLEEADSRKWKRVIKDIVVPDYLEMYSEIESEVILLAAETDKMHEVNQTNEIAEVIENSQYVDLKTNKATHGKEVVKVMRTYIKENFSK